MKNKRLTLLLLIGILFGVMALGITVYPLVGNYYSDKNKSTVLTAYTATVNDLEDGNIDAMLAAAHAYNQSLTSGVISMESVFTREGQEYAAEDYYELLNVNAAGIMGYVEIPKISVNLPIYHGTDSDTLEVGDTVVVIAHDRVLHDGETRPEGPSPDSRRRHRRSRQVTGGTGS